MDSTGPGDSSQRGSLCRVTHTLLAWWKLVLQRVGEDSFEYNSPGPPGWWLMRSNHHEKSNAEEPNLDFEA
jgi:hypothetical protein